MTRWVVAMVVLASCGVPEGAEKTLVFGHGGMGAGFEFPMDSHASLRTCLDAGTDGVEIDLHLTGDSVLVAYHDEDLSTMTACSGHVNEHTWSELRSCEYGDVPINMTLLPKLVRLDDFLASLPDSIHPLLTFDCKLFSADEDWSGYLNSFVAALSRVVARHQLEGRVNIECMDTGFQDRVKSGVSGSAVFLYATNAAEGIRIAHEHGYAGITIDRNLIDQKQVAEAHALGLRVTLFGAGGSWSHRSALALGADMIQTDDPEGLLRMLGR